MTNLHEFHHTEETPDRKARFIVAAVIIVAMGAFGIYVYESGMWNPQPNQAVADGNLPSP